MVPASCTTTRRSRRAPEPAGGGFFPPQHLVEQVDGDAVGEFGHGQVGEFSGRAVNIERGPDLTACSLEQVEPGMSLLKQRDCMQAAGDVQEGAHRPEHLAVVHHPVRRPRDESALAWQGKLQVHVDHGNARRYHLIGEGALDQGRVHAVVDL
jgi:hypothetical protein